MQRLEVNGVVRPLYGSLGIKGLIILPSTRKQQVLWKYLQPATKPQCVTSQKIVILMFTTERIPNFTSL